MRIRRIATVEWSTSIIARNYFTYKIMLKTEKILPKMLTVTWTKYVHIANVADKLHHAGRNIFDVRDTPPLPLQAIAKCRQLRYKAFTKTNDSCVERRCIDVFLRRDAHQPTAKGDIATIKYLFVPL